MPIFQNPTPKAADSSAVAVESPANQLDSGLAPEMKPLIDAGRSVEKLIPPQDLSWQAVVENTRRENQSHPVSGVSAFLSDEKVRVAEVMGCVTGKIEKQSQMTAENPMACDGKFSWAQAWNNVVSGAGDLAKAAFGTPRNAALTLGAMAVGTIAFLTIPEAAVVLAAVGLAYGGFKLGQGIYRAITSNSGDALEESFRDMGQGALVLGLSGLARGTFPKPRPGMPPRIPSSLELGLNSSRVAAPAALAAYQELNEWKEKK